MMDPILESSSYLVPDWIDRLLEDSKNEVSANDPSWPIKTLGMTTRKMVWNLCGSLGVHSKGIPGQVCRLVELYLVTRFTTMSVTETTMVEWDEFKHSLVASMPLLIASAIQISGKMSSMADYVRPSTVQRLLKIKGMSFTIKEITTSEFEFFKTLNFRLPLWTSVDSAELLALELGMPQEMMPGVSIIVDLAEFNRYKIEKDLVTTASSYAENLGRSYMRTLDLCAGSVVAAARHLNFQGPDPALRLSSLIRVPCLYLTCVSNLILHHIQDDHTEPLILKKRKIFTD